MISSNLFLSETITVLILLFFFLIILIFLKPFKFHTKRKISTALLKFSYLAYLLFLFSIIYKFIFYKNLTMFDENGNMVSVYSTIMLVFLLIGFVLPNIGIIIRRKIKNREPYNIFLTFINVFFILYLSGLYLFSKWMIKFVDAI
jgi:hypothetical protein